MRALLFSTLYPSASRPGHGVFVEKRAVELVNKTDVQVHVVAPVPWFPFRSPKFGAYASLANTPKKEVRNSLQIEHPRYFLLPKVGMTLAPLALALGAWRVIRRLQREGGRFDLIDAHYAYPDGVAAVMIGQWLQIPVVITARGSDLNVIARHRAPRLMIRWAVRRAFACIGVSSSLASQLSALGAREVHVMRNGVDKEVFRAIDQQQARQEISLTGSPVVLTVGNLVHLKRQHWVIESIAALASEFPSAVLLIVGHGPAAAELRALANRLGVSDRVHVVGAVRQSDLSAWYSAADVTVLCSQHEGWPNVLLESMACGTPVVATPVGGIPEIVTGEHLGLLVDGDSASALTVTLAKALRKSWNRVALRAHAASMSWDETSNRQHALFARACNAQRGPTGA